MSLSRRLYIFLTSDQLTHQQILILFSEAPIISVRRNGLKKLWKELCFTNKTNFVLTGSFSFGNPSHLVIFLRPSRKSHNMLESLEQHTQLKEKESILFLPNSHYSTLTSLMKLILTNQLIPEITNSFKVLNILLATPKPFKIR